MSILSPLQQELFRRLPRAVHLLDFRPLEDQQVNEKACQVCENLGVFTFPLINGFEKLNMPVQTTLGKVDRQTLISSREDGCRHCWILSEAIHFIDPERKSDNSYLAVKLGADNGFRLNYGSQDFEIYADFDSQSLQYARTHREPQPDIILEVDRWDVRRLNSTNLFLTDLAVFASIQSRVLSSTVPRTLRDIDPDPMCPDNLAFMREWLEFCKENHEACAHDVVGPPPRRLLDVGFPGDEEVKLVDQIPVGVEYAALSHCWGNSEMFCTKTANYDRHKQGVLFSDLPQTFQDAVTLVRALGVQYVWVDSLCIIQDDPQDWASEAAKMAAVYSNAHLTIAAARSDDSQNGFLHHREKYTSRTLQMPHDAPLLPQLKIRKTADADWDIKRLPWFSRSWIFQERLLSRRLIIIGDANALECAESRHFEGGMLPSQLPGERYGYAARRATLNQALSNATPRSTVYEEWERIVTQYSALNLGYEKDVLPALAGVARLFQARLKDRYLAGLWSGNISRELIWMTFSAAPLPREYRAPSWSWASVKAGVHTSKEIEEGWEEKFTPLCELVDSQCTPKGPDEFGELAGGFIKLSGQGMKVGLTMTILDTGKCSVKSMQGMDGKVVEKGCYLDSPITTREVTDSDNVKHLTFRRGPENKTAEGMLKGTAFCFLVSRNTRLGAMYGGKDQNCHFFLLLSPTSGSATPEYERIGSFSIYNDKWPWMDSMPMTEILII